LYIELLNVCAAPVNKPLIYEPMTAFTDVLIFGLGLYFAREVYFAHVSKLLDVHLHFALVFLFMGLAGLFGALTHGIGPHFPQGIHTFIWRITLYCIGLSTFSMLMGGFYHVVPYQTMDWLKWLPFLALVVYLVAVTRNDDFKTADTKTIKLYEDELEKKKIIVTVRRSRGQDIDAACGQLANKEVSLN